MKKANKNSGIELRFNSLTELRSSRDYLSREIKKERRYIIETVKSKEVFNSSGIQILQKVISLIGVARLSFSAYKAVKNITEVVKGFRKKS